MANRYIRLTEAERGCPLFIRDDVIAAVGVFQGRTCLALTVDDVDYYVKESPEQVLKALGGTFECLTVNPSYGTIRGQRRNQHGAETRCKGQTASSERISHGPSAVQQMERDETAVL